MNLVSRIYLEEMPKEVKLQQVGQQRWLGSAENTALPHRKSHVEGILEKGEGKREGEKDERGVKSASGDHGSI